MNTQRINITLPYSTIKELQMNVAAGKRSRFIAQAISEQLQKRNLKKQLQKGLKENLAFYQEAYKDWKAIEIEKWPK